jgi:hypothetical protein
MSNLTPAIPPNNPGGEDFQGGVLWLAGDWQLAALAASSVLLEAARKLLLKLLRIVRGKARGNAQ